MLEDFPFVERLKELGPHVDQVRLGMRQARPSRMTFDEVATLFASVESTLADLQAINAGVIRWLDNDAAGWTIGDGEGDIGRGHLLTLADIRNGVSELDRGVNVILQDFRDFIANPRGLTTRRVEVMLSAGERALMYQHAASLNSAEWIEDAIGLRPTSPSAASLQDPESPPPSIVDRSSPDLMRLEDSAELFGILFEHIGAGLQNLRQAGELEAVELLQAKLEDARRLCLERLQNEPGDMSEMLERLFAEFRGL